MPRPKNNVCCFSTNCSDSLAISASSLRQASARFGNWRKLVIVSAMLLGVRVSLSASVSSSKAANWVVNALVEATPISGPAQVKNDRVDRSEEHTSELQSLMRISYAVFCLKKKTKINRKTHKPQSE